jgi:hypothetical protein
VLLQNFDLDFGEPMWSHDGKTVYWSTGQGTRSRSSVVSTSSPASSHDPPRRSPASTADTSCRTTIRTVGFQSQHGHAVDRSLGGEAPGQCVCDAHLLTNSNPWIEKDQVQLGRVETIKWDELGWRDDRGSASRDPVGYTVRTRYPLIVNPHGGRAASVDEAFSSTNQPP